MKILVIDDSKVMRAIVKRTLRQAGFGGHETEEAVNGAEGFDKVGSFAPDLILCDWNMPELNGLGLLQKLRESGNETPFIFVTSEGSEDMRQTAADAGAAALIAKPFTAEQFEEHLKPFLSEAA